MDDDDDDEEEDDDDDDDDAVVDCLLERLGDNVGDDVEFGDAAAAAIAGVGGANATSNTQL